MKACEDHLTKLVNPLDFDFGSIPEELANEARAAEDCLIAIEKCNQELESIAEKRCELREKISAFESNIDPFILRFRNWRNENARLRSDFERYLGQTVPSKIWVDKAWSGLSSRSTSTARERESSLLIGQDTAQSSPNSN
jgi:hypothetical protein